MATSGINRLQLPEALTVPQLNFKPLGEIGEAIGSARRRDQIAEALTGATTDGKLDPETAAVALNKIGAVKEALPFLNLAQQRDVLSETKRLHDATIANNEASRRLQEQGLAQSGENQRAQRDFQRQELDFRKSEATARREGEAVPAGFMRDTTGGSFAPGAGGYEGQGPFKSEVGLKPIPGGPQDPSYIESSAKAKLAGGEGLLDPDTLKAMAQQARAGDTSVMTNLGRGAQGAANVIALRAEIARQNAGAGEGGTEQAMRNAEFFGTKSGQRTLGNRQANIELAATEFTQVLPVVQKASEAVDRTRYPKLNQVIQSFEKGTGDPNIVAFGGGINTLINLYARAISPTGTPTVSDKDHAREILDKAWSQGQFNAAVGMMKQEVDAALQSPTKVRDEMRKRFTGGRPGAASSASPSSASVENHGQVSESLSNARDAIKNGWPRDQVIKKLIDGGVPPEMANKI